MHQEEVSSLFNPLRKTSPKDWLYPKKYFQPEYTLRWNLSILTGLVRGFYFFCSLYQFRANKAPNYVNFGLTNWIFLITYAFDSVCG